LTLAGARAKVCAMREAIMQALQAAIEEVNETRPRDARISSGPDTPLIGVEGGLDSLGLVNFAVTAEEQLDAALGTSLQLSSLIGMSVAESPFRTLATLADYIAANLEAA
jgi:acyl carrier protein